MPKEVIRLDKVTKSYGKARGIANVSLSVPPGTVFGFLGPNGAGKTTTISLMVDLIRPTSGKISIFGLDSVSGSINIRQRIGYLAGDIALDKSLTGWQQLEYFAKLRGNFNKKRVRELAERLDCKLNRKFKTLSRGNRQKIGLISALMHEPELLILDEPTSGLDPLIQAEFNKIIIERQQQGLTAFISSHMLSEVQELCDHVAFIREGKIIGVKTLEDLAKNSPRQIRIISQDKKLFAKLKGLSGIKESKQKSNIIEATYNGKIDSLVRLLASHKIDALNINDADLETIFMKYYEDKNV